MSSDWGPLPALMHHVAPAAADEWVNALDRPGGLWAVAAGRSIAAIWPPGFPPKVSIAPRPRQLASARLARLWRSLVRRFNALFSRSRLSQSVPQSDGEDLLRQCHRWLGLRNLESLSRWFAPFWPDTPTPLAQISGQGLIWTAAVCHLDRWGPESFTQAKIPLAPRDQRVLGGDCVAFHLAIETLVATLPERIGIAPAVTERAAGGLRSARTLAVLSALASAPRTSKKAAWRAAIATLAAHSPLTRIVYADLSDTHPIPAGGWFEPLFRCEVEARRSSRWLEVWRSQVARSLVGALLSPPPAFERVQDLRRDLAKALARRPILAGLHVETIVTDEERKLQLAVNKAEGEMTGEYLARLPLLSSALAAENGFHHRFVDMAVRQVVADCSGPMVNAWRGLAAAARAAAPEGRKHSAEPDAEARRLFFYGREAICYSRFEQLVFGPAGFVLPSTLGRTLPASSSDVAAARDEVRRLRPADGDSSGVRDLPVSLPVQEPSGDSPAAIWRAWITTIDDRFPAEASVVQTTVQQTGGDPA